MSELTVRGRCFVAAGAAAVLCGIWVGEQDFVRIGLLTLLVPTLSWLLLRRTPRSVWVRRELSSLRVEAGETARVEVVVGNSGRRTGLLLLEDELDPALGERQRFAVGPLAPGEVTPQQYRIRARVRGRYPVGPMHVRVADPFAMVALDQVLTSTADILVTPRTEPLAPIGLTGRWAGAGDNRTRDFLGAGSPDVAIREYHLGDDLRRIHWPTSARVDELMVRREEQEWQSRCTLLVDNRQCAHAGAGEASSLEAAVSATASILLHLVARDFEVRLVTATGESSSHGWHQGARGAALSTHLERLALLQPSPSTQLATGWVDDSQHGGMILAVLGRLTPRDLEVLAGFAAAGDSAYAVMLDVDAWESGRPTPAPATASLRRHGWKASTLTPEGPLAAAWQELGR